MNGQKTPLEAEAKPTNLAFGQAIQYLRTGYAVQRDAWRGTGVFVFLRPEALDPNGVTHEAHLCQHTLKGGVVPWAIDHEDVLAEDWEVA
jgi:hypothetical protein